MVHAAGFGVDGGETHAEKGMLRGFPCRMTADRAIDGATDERSSLLARRVSESARPLADAPPCGVVDPVVAGGVLFKVLRGNGLTPLGIGGRLCCSGADRPAHDRDNPNGN